MSNSRSARTADDTRAAPSTMDNLLTPRRQLAFLAIFLFALAVRGAYLWSEAYSNPIFRYPQMDSLVHHQWAQRIASGQGMEARPYLRAPLYYYLLGGLYAVFGSNVVLARAFGCLLGAVSCYLIARLGNVLAGFRAGLLAGVLAAVYWPLIYFDAELLTVALEVLLNVALLLALLAAARRNSSVLFLVAGVVWGLAAITRPNVLAAAPVIWLWAWWSSRPRAASANVQARPAQPIPAPGFVRRLRNPLLVTVGLAAMVLPVTLRNWFVGGEPVLIASTGGINFYIGNNPQSTGYLVYVPGTRPTWDEWLIDIKRIPEEQLGHKLSDRAASQYWAGRAWDWIRAEPGAWLAHTLYKFRLFWSPIEIPDNQPIGFLFKRSAFAPLLWFGFPIIATLALPGLFARRRKRAPWRLLIAFSTVYMLTIVAFFCPARYRMPVVPLLIVAAASGLAQLADWLRRRQFRPVSIYALVCAAVAVFVATNPPERQAFAAQDEAEGHYLLGRYFATPAPNGPGDFTKAADEYRQAVRARGSTEDRLALARVLLELDRYDEAAEQFADAVARDPHNADARLQYAQYLVSAKQLPAAADQYRELLELRPRDADAHQQLGAILAQLNEGAEAVSHLRAAVAADPTDVDARFNLATTLLRQDAVDEAERLLAEVVRQKPAHALAWQHLGVAAARRGRMDEAITAFQQALAHDPALAEASVNLARALRKSGRHADALPVLTKAHALSPANAQVLSALAMLLASAPQAELRDGARALSLAQQAAAVGSPPPIPALDALAAAHAELGQFEPAMQVARRALAAARSAGSAYWVNELEARLRKYEQSQPWRE